MMINASINPLKRLLCVLGYGIFSVISIFANTEITYSTTNNVAVAPQGGFFDANDASVLCTNQTTTKLTFDGTVRKIDSYAFHNCSKLKTLTLPESVTEVGYMAFTNCTAITKTIKNSKILARLPITRTGTYEVDEGITEVASGAFYQCDQITAVSMPSTLQKIGSCAFAGCSSLLAIEFPQQVRSIGECAFFGCTNLVAICSGYEPATIDATTFNLVDKNTCTLYVPEGTASLYKSKPYWKEFTNIVEGGIYGNCEMEAVPLQILSNNYATFTIKPKGVSSVTTSSFDIILPSGITVSSGSSAVKSIKSVNSTTTHIEVDFSGQTTSEFSLKLKAGSITAGVNKISFRNVVIKTPTRNYLADNGYCTIFMGSSPKAVANTSGVVQFYGNFSTSASFSLLQQAIPGETKILDIRKVTAVPRNSSLTVPFANALILTSQDLGLKNDHNIVVDNVCEKLVVTDGCDFVNTMDFSATSAVYTRNMSSRWGTICVPFELTSDGNVQYYSLASSNVTSSKATLSFSPVSVVEPGVPAVFKKITSSDNSVSIVSTGSDVILSGGDYFDDCNAVVGWQMKGTFSSLIVNPSSSVYANKHIYYIAQDKFWLTTKDLTLPAYRCWFEVSSSASGASIRFDIDDETTALDVIEEEDGDVEFSMDLMGRRKDGVNSNVGLKIQNGKVLFAR